MRVKEGNRHTEKDRHTERNDRHIDREKGRQPEENQAGRQTNKGKGKHTDTQPGRQREGNRQNKIMNDKNKGTSRESKKTEI